MRVGVTEDVRGADGRPVYDLSLLDERAGVEWEWMRGEGWQVSPDAVVPVVGASCVDGSSLPGRLRPVRGFCDGRTKYARYYGVGGGYPSTGLWGRDPGTKLYDVDADFDDQDHEWYDLQEDPHELVNLAHDRARRADLHDQFNRMLSLEAAEFA